MAIIPWKPFSDMGRFFEDEENWMPIVPMRKFLAPSMDIYQTKDEVVVEIPLAGVPPEKVEVTIENDVITVKGEMEEKKEVKHEDYYKKEIRRGSFVRQAALPVAVKGDEAKAESRNGLLKIVIPKSEKAKPKKIAVKVSEKK